MNPPGMQNVTQLAAYQAVARNLPDITVLVFDNQLRYVVAEGRDLPVLGFSHGRMIGYTLREALPSGMAQRYEPHYLNALNGLPYVLEETFAEGRSTYEIRILPARDDNGTIFGGVVMCRNITAQRSSDVRLRESEQRVRALMRAVPDTLLVFNGHGLLVDVIHNRGSNGYLVDQMMIPGTNLRDMQVPEIVMRVGFTLIERALQTGKTHADNIEFSPPSKPVEFYEIRCVPLGAEQVLMVIRNTTELRSAQRALQAHLDDLTTLRGLEAHLTDSIDFGVVLDVGIEIATRVSGADSGFLGVLEGPVFKMLRHFGAPQNENVESLMQKGICARVMQRLIPEYVADVLSDPDYYALNSDTVSQITIPLIAHGQLIGLLSLETSDSQRFTQEQFDKLRLLAGRLAVALDNARLHDQTVQQLEQLRELHERVSELERLKTDMLKLGAHDLRNPLMSLMNYANFLHEDLSVDEQTNATLLQYVDEIRQSAERMQMISTDILDAERVEQLVESTELAELDYGETLVEAAYALRPNAEMKRHQLNLITAETPLRGRGDAPLIRAAAGNLISNAIKYTPDGGEVNVVIAEQNGYVEFTVTDNGYGIPKETQEKLFQPMIRAKTREVRNVEGTGFGLYLVKRIIERHGGEVFFQSEYRKGSTFGFRLPLE